MATENPFVKLFSIDFKDHVEVKKSGNTNACICFGFNGDGWSPYGAVAYGGSALFIDGVGENGKMNSGYGDIKISGKDMTKLLSYLDSDYNPTITIRAAQ